jgi:hypothetical protein
MGQQSTMKTNEKNHEFDEKLKLIEKAMPGGWSKAA